MVLANGPGDAEDFGLRQRGVTLGSVLFDKSGHDGCFASTPSQHGGSERGEPAVAVAAGDQGTYRFSPLTDIAFFVDTMPQVRLYNVPLKHLPVQDVAEGEMLSTWSPVKKPGRVFYLRISSCESPAHRLLGNAVFHRVGELLIEHEHYSRLWMCSRAGWCFVDKGGETNDERIQRERIQG